jgi:hypothetical protein
MANTTAPEDEVIFNRYKVLEELHKRASIARIYSVSLKTNNVIFRTPWGVRKL